MANGWTPERRMRQSAQIPEMAAVGKLDRKTAVGKTQVSRNA
jgi:hypothetical protein